MTNPVPATEGGTPNVTVPTVTVVIGDVEGQARAHARLLATIDATYPDADIVYVGDLTREVSGNVDVYRQVIDLIESGRATLVKSNRGVACVRRLGALLNRGNNVVEAAVALYETAAQQPDRPAPRYIATLAGQLAGEPDGEDLARKIVAVERSAPIQHPIDDGAAVVVHGGMRADLLGEDSRRAERVCVHGTAGDTPADRDGWIDAYRTARAGDTTLPVVIHGHVTYNDVHVTDATVGVDTGACDGNTLTAAVWQHGTGYAGTLSVPVEDPASG